MPARPLIPLLLLLHCCTTALGCCHQLQSPTTPTTTPSRPSTAASLPAHFACQPTNNLLCSLSCQEGAQLLLSRTTTTTMCTVRPSLSDWWPVGWSFHLHRLALLCPTRADPPYTHHTGHHILKHHHHNCPLVLLLPIPHRFLSSMKRL